MFEYAKGLNICNRYRMSKKNYFGEKSPCYVFGYPDHAYDQTKIFLRDLALRLVPPLYLVPW